MDAQANLNTYLGKRETTARYTSFDYCFNHFRKYYENGQLSALTEGPNLELSCLHLGFYLASWGMFRGAADLLNRSIKHYVPLIDFIAAAKSDIWMIDADRYTDRAIDDILGVARQIRATLPGGATDTLVSKIMLGVFGCVPAFDRNFRQGFDVSTLGPKALRKIGRFYTENAETIDSNRVPTLDFETGKYTERMYTRAKVIDMIFFVEGGS